MVLAVRSTFLDTITSMFTVISLFCVTDLGDHDVLHVFRFYCSLVVWRIMTTTSLNLFNLFLNLRKKVHSPYKQIRKFK